MPGLPAYPATAALKSAAAFPVNGQAFAASTPVALQRNAMMQQLAKTNPNLVRSLPNIPVDLLPK